MIPVAIYVSKGGNRQQNVGKIPNNAPNKTLQPTLDSFLSGNYVVMGMEVYWTLSGGMRQKLILARRTWQANSSGASKKAFPISVLNK